MEIETIIYVHGEPCIDGIDTWQRLERNTDENVKNTWRKSRCCFCASAVGYLRAKSCSSRVSSQ